MVQFASRAREVGTVSLRISFSDGLILFGGVLGATPAGWWLGGLYGALMAAHVAILVGLLLDLTRRRFCLTAAMLFIVWWPAWLGQWFWE